jgi:hypothetical protein
MEPMTGRRAWKKVLRRGPVAADGKGKTPIRPNRILNDILKSDGQALSLPGIAFTPDTPDAELQKAVDGQDEPKKKR